MHEQMGLMIHGLFTRTNARDVVFHDSRNVVGVVVETTVGAGFLLRQDAESLNFRVFVMNRSIYCPFAMIFIVSEAIWS